jgi:hypothetical protein
MTQSRKMVALLIAGWEELIAATSVTVARGAQVARGAVQGVRGGALAFGSESAASESLVTLEGIGAFQEAGAAGLEGISAFEEAGAATGGASRYTLRWNPAARRNPWGQVSQRGPARELDPNLARDTRLAARPTRPTQPTSQSNWRDPRQFTAAGAAGQGPLVFMGARLARNLAESMLAALRRAVVVAAAAGLITAVTAQSIVTLTDEDSTMTRLTNDVLTANTRAPNYNAAGTGVQFIVDQVKRLFAAAGEPEPSSAALDMIVTTAANEQISAPQEEVSLMQRVQEATAAAAAAQVSSDQLPLSMRRRRPRREERQEGQEQQLRRRERQGRESQTEDEEEAPSSSTGTGVYPGILAGLIAAAHADPNPNPNPHTTTSNPNSSSMDQYTNYRANPNSRQDPPPDFVTRQEFEREKSLNSYDHLELGKWIAANTEGPTSITENYNRLNRLAGRLHDIDDRVTNLRQESTLTHRHVSLPPKSLHRGDRPTDGAIDAIQRFNNAQAFGDNRTLDDLTREHTAVQAITQTTHWTREALLLLSFPLGAALLLALWRRVRPTAPLSAYLGGVTPELEWNPRADALPSRVMQELDFPHAFYT